VAASFASNSHFSARSSACASTPWRLAIGRRARTSDAAITRKPAGARCHSSSEPFDPLRGASSASRARACRRFDGTRAPGGVKHRDGQFRYTRARLPIRTSPSCQCTRARFFPIYTSPATSPGGRPRMPARLPGLRHGGEQRLEQRGLLGCGRVAHVAREERQRASVQLRDRAQVGRTSASPPDEGSIEPGEGRES
jgi:hypothetical protein